jgi:hypothetical protein
VVDVFSRLVRLFHDAVPPAGGLAFPLDSKLSRNVSLWLGLPLAFAGATQCQLLPLSAFPTGSN